MDCYYHSGTKQAGTCDRCNKPLCSKCIVSFKNPKSHLSVDEEEDKRDYLEQLDDELPRLEELNWCLPCYYAHFNYNLRKGEEIGHKIFSLVVELVAYSIVALILIYIANLELQANISLNLLFTPIGFGSVVVIYAIAFVILFYYRSKQLKAKRVKLDEIKEKFLTITNVGTIDLPIDCFYCKHEIDPESFVCMNLECTLGEEVNKDAREIPIDPVNENYGFFATLKKLPKFPPEDDNK